MTIPQRPGLLLKGKALGLGAAALLLWFAGSAVFRGEGDSKPGPVSLGVTARPSAAAALIERLQRTRLLNGEEIYRTLGLGETGRDGFLTQSPYELLFRGSTPGKERVLRWHASLPGNTEVCGVLFADPDGVDYRLRTFPDEKSALTAGYVITHRNHCGTCSSLRNFAAYLARPDLTSPARNCVRRLTASGMKACFMEDLGFEERCAETWTYNALYTRRHCLSACIGHYGLWNVLTGDISAPHTDERGNLNPCLACDEEISGPGFQYVAGRTRRSSGLTSAIRRRPAEIYPVDHTRYFR